MLGQGIQVSQFQVHLNINGITFLLPDMLLILPIINRTLNLSQLQLLILLHPDQLVLTVIHPFQV